MTKQKSTLENALEEAIEEIETEKKEIAAQIKQLHKELKDLDRKISDYRVALNHAKGREEPPLPSNPKFRNLRFQTSPQQLIAQVLKQEPSKWLTVKEITYQAMKLDGQEIEEVIPYKQSQTIACTLNYLKYKLLVEKCLIDNSQHWRLRTLDQG